IFSRETLRKTPPPRSLTACSSLPPRGGAFFLGKPCEKPRPHVRSLRVALPRLLTGKAGLTAPAGRKPPNRSFRGIMRGCPESARNWFEWLPKRTRKDHERR